MLVAIPLFVVFLPTAAWSRQRVDVDGFTNVVTAWRLGTSGTPYLPDHVPLTEPEYPGYLSWIVAFEDTAIGKYPPGAAFHAAPLYAVWPQDAELQDLDISHLDLAAPPPVPVPPYGPAAITSALVVALAMGFLALSFRKVGSGRTAAGGAYVAGLGTAAWSVAANTLWQHGPSMMWIALAGTLAVGHFFASGAAYGVALLVGLSMRSSWQPPGSTSRGRNAYRKPAERLVPVLRSGWLRSSSTTRSCTASSALVATKLALSTTW